MMDIMGGAGYGEQVDVAACAGGRNRGVGASSGRDSSFSLAWDAAAEAQGPNLGRGGKRVFAGAGAANREVLPKDAYAAALHQQIADRDERRAADGHGQGRPPLGARQREPSQGSYGGGGGGAVQREPSPFARLGGAMVDQHSKLAAHAEALQQQIEQQRHEKAAARQYQLKEDRADDRRVEAERSQYNDRRQREVDVQSRRHEDIAARGDALERFMSGGGQGDGGYDGAGAKVAAGARAQDRRAGGQPPRAPDGGGGGALPGAGGLERRSSNVWATGANQNCGNMLSERPTSRVLAPPGGKSTFSLG